MVDAILASPIDSRKREDLTCYVGVNNIAAEILAYKIFLIDLEIDKMIKENSFSIVRRQNIANILSKLVIEMSQEQADRIEKLKRNIINKYIDKIGEDLVLTDAELKGLESLGIELNTTLTPDEQIRMKKLIKYTAALTGRYEPVPCKYQLSPKEVLYFESEASFNELRHYQGRGNFAIPQDKLVSLDVGDILLTSQKVLFIGRSKTLKMPFEKIIDFKYYKDGIEINRGTSKSAVFLFDDDPLLFGILFNVLRKNLEFKQEGRGKHGSKRFDSDVKMEFCYEVLGLTPSATKEEVLSAYREKAKVYHPDVGGDKHFFSILTKAKNSILENIG